MVCLKIRTQILLACTVLAAAAIAGGQAQPDELILPSGGRHLHGFLWKPPVFLIQAESDYGVSPSRVLSKEAGKKKRDFQSKIYPAFGKSHQDGHCGFCSTATDVWGADVLAFLVAQMKTAP
jgi:hypothetical protein